jgi:hypothetical protein
MVEVMANNKALIIVGVSLVAVLILSVGFNILVDAVSDRVIHKIYKEYSPSPYGPGVDPDRLDVNVFNRKTKQSSEKQTTRQSNPWD